MGGSSGVLLGRDGKPMRPKRRTIYVPEQYADEPLIGHCRVPTGEGTICGAKFYRGQEQRWQEHVGKCARRHMDVIEHQRQQHRESIFHPNQWDPEAERHMREVGRRMVKERRFEVKPHEKIVTG